MTFLHTITAFSILTLGGSDHRPNLPYNPDQVHLSLKELEDIYAQERKLQEKILLECQKQKKNIKKCIYSTSPSDDFIHQLRAMNLKQVFGSALVLRRDDQLGYSQDIHFSTKEAAHILLNAASNELWKRNWCLGPSHKKREKQHFILCSDDKDPQPFH